MEGLFKSMTLFAPWATVALVVAHMVLFVFLFERHGPVTAIAVTLVFVILSAVFAGVMIKAKP